MSLTLDPDIAGRRAMWEPIIGAASTAQPIPADVTIARGFDFLATSWRLPRLDLAC
jgi:hypothetical protein